MNRFYTERETDCALRLRRLAKALERPGTWLPAVAEFGRLSSEGVEVSLASLVPQLSLDGEHAAALREFVELCGEVGTPLRPAIAPPPLTAPAPPPLLPP